MSDWTSFNNTVSTMSWARIRTYIEDAQETCTLDNYPGISSWYDMASALSMHENGMPLEGYDDLIKDYKLYWEALG